MIDAKRWISSSGLLAAHGGALVSWVLAATLVLITMLTVRATWLALRA